MTKPIRKVSASKYPPSAPSPVPALIRVRLKGSLDGPIYQGQRIIQPCSTCGG